MVGLNVLRTNFAQKNMAIDIQETFEIAAPIDTVWDFFLTPDNIVVCMPGASLTEIVDTRHFMGKVKVKLGTVSTRYQGSITYQKLDKNSYTMELLAAGNERGGGSASATIATQLIQLAGNRGTEVRCNTCIDIAGRIAQLSRGMIEGIARQIIKKYVTNVRVRLERDLEPVAAGIDSGSAGPPPLQDNSINIVTEAFTALGNGRKHHSIPTGVKAVGT